MTFCPRAISRRCPRQTHYRGAHDTLHTEFRDDSLAVVLEYSTRRLSARHQSCAPTCDNRRSVHASRMPSKDTQRLVKREFASSRQQSEHGPASTYNLSPDMLSSDVLEVCLVPEAVINER